MQALASKTITIVGNYCQDPCTTVERCSELSALQIDRLDLPMILLDLEDAFNIHIGYDDDIELCKTVDDLIVCVGARLEAKLAEYRVLCSIPRIKRSWVSTEAEQRR